MNSWSLIWLTMKVGWILVAIMCNGNFTSALVIFQSERLVNIKNGQLRLHKWIKHITQCQLVKAKASSTAIICVHVCVCGTDKVNLLTSGTVGCWTCEIQSASYEGAVWSPGQLHSRKNTIVNTTVFLKITIVNLQYQTSVTQWHIPHSRNLVICHLLHNHFTVKFI